MSITLNFITNHRQGPDAVAPDVAAEPSPRISAWLDGLRLRARQMPGRSAIRRDVGRASAEAKPGVGQLALEKLGRRPVGRVRKGDQVPSY